MSIPENVKAYRINGTLVRAANGSSEVYTLAYTPRQALDRAFSTLATFSDRESGSATISIIPIGEVPKAILEDLVSRYYSDKPK